MRLFTKHTLALAALAATSPLLFAQASTSSVQLYGIVDVAIRHTNNEGAGQDGLTQMIGGGMSQSRWGLNVTEDMGGGLKALANMEARFTADNGAQAVAQFFQQSWVGLQSNSFGRITMGRQYNVLFDLVTSTYASFPYSPYAEEYKPEIGMSLGARNSNMIKYAAEFGPVKGELQYAFGEKAATGGNSVGGMLRYADGGLALGGGYQTYKFASGNKIDAWTVGGSYRTGGWYFNTGYGHNKVKGTLAPGADTIVLGAIWSGVANGGFHPGMVAGTAPNGATIYAATATKRTMWTVGAGYQITPQLNLGAHYYHAKQDGSPLAAYNGKANFLVAVADYAFSKRTDAYFGVDHTKVSGGAGLAIDKSNNARSRTGFMVGLRHRF